MVVTSLSSTTQTSRFAIDRLGRASASFQKAASRLASGCRIVSPSDDAAGLSLAAGLGLDARVYTQGVRNLNDAVAMLNVAEGAVTVMVRVALAPGTRSAGRLKRWSVSQGVAAQPPPALAKWTPR